MKKKSTSKQGNIFDKVVKENLDEVFIPFVISHLGIDITTISLKSYPTNCSQQKSERWIYF